MKEDEIEVYDSSGGFTSGKAFTLSIYSKDKEELEQLKKDILEAWELKKKIDSGMFMTEDHKICANNCADFAEKCGQLEAQVQKYKQFVESVKKEINNDPYELFPCQECGLDGRIKQLIEELK